MSNLTSVGISSGVPNSGTGTVSTIDALMADGGQATLGITTGAAVTTDATGTLQQYLRGLVKLIAAGISVTVSAATGLAQGSTTSGQTGSLIMAATKKTAPTNTDGQTNTINADPAGNITTIGGGLGVITGDNWIQASDGAQTNAALVSVSAGTKIVLTQISAVVGAAVTAANCGITIGFGTANVPTPTLAGVAGIVLHGKFAAGGGQQKGNGGAVIAVGADGEDLRITCDSPTGGAIYVTYSYYTVAA